MKTMSKKNPGNMAGVQHIVQNISIEQQQRFKDTQSEPTLFGSVAEDLTIFEWQFLQHHFNRQSKDGLTVSIENLKLFPATEMKQFIQSIHVGEFGQTVIDCIQTKLAIYNQNF